LESGAKLNVNLWLNYVNNNLGNTESITQSAVETVRIEDGQPQGSLRILSSYKLNKLQATLNVSRYGSYSQMIDGVSYTFEGETTVDVDVAYKITKDFKIAIGGTNVFNAIPNEWDGLSGDFYGSNGIKPYSRYSPFGYSGAYYYLRASMEF